MKAMKKVLALGLALAMVVTAVPVTSAEAASAKLPAKKTYYVGKTNTLKLNATKVKKTAWSKTGAAVKLSAKAKKSVKVTAVKAGTSTVKAKVTYTTGKSKTYSCKVTVKNPVITVPETATVAVNSKASVAATKKAPSSATVAYKSADETIATVDAATGEVTGVKAGEVKITATLTCGTETVAKETVVTVKNVILKDLSQKTFNTFTAVVEGKTSDLKTSDFSFVNVATKATVAIKEIAVDKTDATKVTITTFANLTDGKAYALTLDGVTKEITVTDGKVSSISVTPTEIPYATETEIKLVAKDANGVVVAESANNTTPNGYTFTITTKTGYVNGNKLYLTNKGDTAVAKVVKHSYKYDTTGKEIETIESGDITITAVDPAAITGFALRIQSGTESKFDDAKDGNTMPVGTSKTAFIKITDANGIEAGAAVYGTYTLASSDASVLQVSGTLAGQDSPITLASIKTGSAYVLVKDAKGNVVASLPIVIQDAAKPVTLALNKTTVVLSNATAIDEKAVLNATAKDQYGADYTIDSDVTVKCNATTAESETVANVNANAANKYFTVANGAVTFNGKDLVKGSYIYEIKYTKGNETTNSVFVTVEVKDPSDSTATDYAFVGDVDTFDTTISDTNKTTKKISFNLYQLKGGVKDSVIADSNVTYSVKKDGKDVTPTSRAAGDEAGIFEDSNEITFVALGVNSGKATKLATGVYTVTATYSNAGKTYTRTATLTITDKQPALTAKVVKDSVAKANATTGEDLVKAAVEFYYNGTKIDTPTVADVKGVCAKANVKTVASLKTEALNTAGYVVTFTEAKITVTVVTGVTYDMTVAIPNGVVTVTE